MIQQYQPPKARLSSGSPPATIYFGS